jgi:hypothetical protein
MRRLTNRHLRRHQPIDTHDADHRVSILQVSVFSWIWFPSRRLSAISAQLDREYPVLRIDEGGQYCNGSPILEACALDEIHSAVSHNLSTLDGCFRLIVRRKHLPWAHVRVISILRSPSAQLPRPKAREKVLSRSWSRNLYSRSPGSASRSCCRVHSAVGCSVALK